MDNKKFTTLVMDIEGGTNKYCPITELSVGVYTEKGLIEQFTFTGEEITDENMYDFFDTVSFATNNILGYWVQNDLNVLSKKLPKTYALMRKYFCFWELSNAVILAIGQTEEYHKFCFEKNLFTSEEHNLFSHRLEHIAEFLGMVQTHTAKEDVELTIKILEFIIKKRRFTELNFRKNVHYFRTYMKTCIYGLVPEKKKEKKTKKAK